MSDTPNNPAAPRAVGFAFKRASPPAKPADSSISSGGVTLTAAKTGEVKPKQVSEFDKESGATPLPVSALVDVAFPVKSQAAYSTSRVFDTMVSALSASLTSRAGGAWESRLIDVASMLRDDPDLLTTLSDEAIRTIMAGIELMGMQDVSRQPKQVSKSMKLSSQVLSIADDLEGSFGLDFDSDFSLD